MIGHVQAFTLPAAFALLPAKMDTPAARALLLAIGLQESGFLARRQRQRGPARGFWQFELGGGVLEVLTRASTRLHLARVLLLQGYPPASTAVYEAIEHNDVLAAVCARLLLWTVKDPLPQRDETERAWQLYVKVWKPGEPHRASWDACYAEAWARVTYGDAWALVTS